PTQCRLASPLPRPAQGGSPGASPIARPVLSSSSFSRRRGRVRSLGKALPARPLHELRDRVRGLCTAANPGLQLTEIELQLDRLPGGVVVAELLAETDIG